MPFLSAALPEHMPDSADEQMVNHMILDEFAFKHERRGNELWIVWKDGTETCVVKSESLANRLSIHVV